MIIDTIANCSNYENCHPAFKKAFDFLRTADLAKLPEGRIDLDGGRLYASIQEVAGIPAEKCVLEAHRKYIDIQFLVTGNESMGWAPLCGLGHALPFDEKADCGFFKDRPQSFFDVRPGCFAIFFPGDAHAPNIGTGMHRKVVVKVAVI